MQVQALTSTVEDLPVKDTGKTPGEALLEKGLCKLLKGSLESLAWLESERAEGKAWQKSQGWKTQ